MNVPITFDFSRWYASYAMSAAVLVLAVAAWGFHTALGGNELFKGEIVE